MPEDADRYQQYLNERHAQWRVPDDRLQEFFRRATGKQSVAFDRIVRGGANEVYLAATEDGEAFVIRILREERDSEPGGAKEEEWCLNACKEVGLPVPSVVFQGSVEIGNQILDALVLTKLRGSPFSDLMPHLSPDQTQTGYFRMGEALSRIHSIKVGGYYRRDPDDGTWDYPNWEVWCEDLYKSRSADAPFLLKAGFSSSDIDRALGCIGRYAEELRGTEAALCHGDCGPEHIFLGDSMELTGVIDFGSYEGDHPVCDFANLSMHIDAGPMEAIGSGYGEDYDDQFIHWVNLRKVPMLIGYLAHHIQQPNHPSTSSYISGLRDALDAM